MADAASAKEKTDQTPPEFTFICQRCQKPWSINAMKRITRFRPFLVVCPDCEKELR